MFLGMKGFRYSTPGRRVDGNFLKIFCSVLGFGGSLLVK